MRERYYERNIPSNRTLGTGKILRSEKNRFLIPVRVTCAFASRRVECAIRMRPLWKHSSDRMASGARTRSRFSALGGVSPMIETVRLEEAPAAYAKLVGGKARRCMVLVAEQDARQSVPPKTPER